MIKPIAHKLAAFLAVAALLSLTLSRADAQDVSVTVDGQATMFNPSPIERAGRVFVPLRGVFERLGATVVYDNGQINATGRGRTVALHVGSDQASVNGQSQALDAAPFIVGASTFVPLRFIAQALGASVNWDNANRVVALGTNGDQPAQTSPMRDPVKSSLRFASREPEPDASVQSNRPTVGVTFDGGRADPNTLRVSLDQLDITADTSRSPEGIVYSPHSDLQPMRHSVRVSGQDTQGRPFDLGWSFSSGTRMETNLISEVTPEDGADVRSSFTVRGRTTPGSHVSIEAGASAQAGGRLTFRTGSFRGDTMADQQGNFSEDVSLNTVPGELINIVISSTAPGTRAAAPQVMRRVTVRGGV